MNRKHTSAIIFCYGVALVLMYRKLTARAAMYRKHTARAAMYRKHTARAVMYKKHTSAVSLSSSSRAAVASVNTFVIVLGLEYSKSLTTLQEYTIYK